MRASLRSYPFVGFTLLGFILSLFALLIAPGKTVFIERGPCDYGYEPHYFHHSYLEVGLSGPAFLLGGLFLALALAYFIFSANGRPLNALLGLAHLLLTLIGLELAVVGLFGLEYFSGLYYFYFDAELYYLFDPMLADQILDFASSGFWREALNGGMNLFGLAQLLFVCNLLWTLGGGRMEEM